MGKGGGGGKPVDSHPNPNPVPAPVKTVQTDTTIKACTICGETTHTACNRYKIQLCQFHETKNGCHRGHSCQFAHGSTELRPHPNTIICECCGGNHKSVLCKKEKLWCTKCQVEGQHSTHMCPLMCENCLRTGHSLEDCDMYCDKCESTKHFSNDCMEFPWCHVCKTDAHRSKDCSKCKHCGANHNSADCAQYVVRQIKVRN